MLACKPASSSSRNQCRLLVGLHVGLTIGISGFLSRGHRAVTPDIMFSVGPRGDLAESVVELGVCVVCTGTSRSFEIVTQPLEFLSSARSGYHILLRCDGNVGNPSPTKQGIGPSSRDKEGEPGSFLNCMDPGVSLECRLGCQGLLELTSRVSSNLLGLRREGGISLETPQWKMVSAHEREESPGFSLAAWGFLSTMTDLRDLAGASGRSSLHWSLEAPSGFRSSLTWG